MQVSHLTQCLKDKEEREVTERKWKEELCLRASELLLPMKKSHTQTTSQPESKEAENAFSEKTWQTKYNCLQERSRQKLAEKEKSWETIEKQLEEE